MIFSRFRWNHNTVLELEEPQVGHIYYRKKRLNLLTGFPETYDIQGLIKKLESTPLQGKVKSPTVYHFTYEFGLHLHGLGHAIDDETPLVVEIEYKKSRKRSPRKSRLEGIKLKCLERPSWSEYKEAFAKIQNHLLDGDCYQVNLTYPFDFETEDHIDPRDLMDLFFSRRGLGAFAHGTYLGEELLISNSPECLFQYSDGRLFTMPIKGTVKREGPLKELWKKLINSPKEEAELFMITDLLKNDLNRLDRPEAKIVKLKAPLLVPGLLHQCSLLSIKLKRTISLEKVMTCLFPGGSIMGAPKKRVMEIIQDVERYRRGFYCGSTLLCYEDKKVASINIRTALINPEQKMWRYAAGGGVTLLSRPVAEFQEMEAKVESFLTLFKAPSAGQKSE